MKIVKVSNFDDEFVDDILICEKINCQHGIDFVGQLNYKYGGAHSRYFYELKEDNYKLYTFEP